MALAGIGLLLGLILTDVDQALLRPAAAAILNRPAEISLKLWHGVNLPLLLSVLTLVAGISMYLAYPYLRRAIAIALDRFPLDFDRIYDHIMAGLVVVATVQTRWLQGGLLRQYLLVVFTTSAVGVGVVLVTHVQDWPAVPWPDLHLYEWIIVAAIVVGSLVFASTHSRIAAICALGIVGSGVSLIFLFNGAPDVAMTQILVEILFVVIIAIVLLRLPTIRRIAERSTLVRFRDASVATLGGSVVAAATFVVSATPPDRKLSDFFARTSVPEAHGGNIVNVILVDFRAFDTLGEIIVVGTAAFAVYALVMALRRRLNPQEERP